MHYPQTKQQSDEEHQFVEMPCGLALPRVAVPAIARERQTGEREEALLPEPDAAIAPEADRPPRLRPAPLPPGVGQCADERLFVCDHFTDQTQRQSEREGVHSRG